MSLCLILQDNNRIFMGSDSALISIKDNLSTRFSIEGQKIFKIKDSLIFCSGNISKVEKVIEYINNLIEINPYEISSFVKKLNVEKKNNIFSIEIVICKKIDEKIEIFQISEYNDFNVLQYEKIIDSVRILSAGIKTKESLEIAEKDVKLKKNVVDIFKNTFDSLSCEEIGGNLEIWEFSDKIKNIYKGNILEKSINLKNEKYNLHSLVGELIVGKILAGNQLTITNNAATFTVDGNAATLTNATLLVRNSSGSVKINPTDGIKITNSSGTNTFYVDGSGNLHLRGTLDAANGTFSGALSAATGTFAGTLSAATGTFAGTLSAATGTFAGALSAATGTFSGTVYANKISGLITNGQIDSLNFSKITSGALSTVTLDVGSYITISDTGISLRNAGGNSSYLKFYHEGVTSNYASIGETDSYGLWVVSPNYNYGTNNSRNDVRLESRYGMVYIFGGTSEFNISSAYGCNINVGTKAFSVTSNYVSFPKAFLSTNSLYVTNDINTDGYIKTTSRYYCQGSPGVSVSDLDPSVHTLTFIGGILTGIG